MELNISNPIEVQNIELQIMKTWVHLSTYLLFVINLSPFTLSNAESTVFRTASLKHSYLTKKKKYIFLFKKGKTKKEWFQLYLADTQNLTLFGHQHDVTTLYGRWIEVEEGKGLMGNFIWWGKTIHAFFKKIERKVPSETLRKRTILFHGKKLDEKIHVEKSSKYTIKGKLTQF